MSGDSQFPKNGLTELLEEFKQIWTVPCKGISVPFGLVRITEMISDVMGREEGGNSASNACQL
jgi:hypothetical protein